MSNSSREVTRLGIISLLFGGLLAITTNSGTFTTDEPHYLATVLGLRDGTFQVELTRGLSYSPELLAFAAGINPQQSTPVSPVAPPLYAFLAYPFSLLGWRALFLVNTIAFIEGGLVLFMIAKRHAQQAHTPWLVLSLFWFGSFSIEYAQGMWPHCLSVALVIGAIAMLFKGADNRNVACSLAGGFAMGLAVGVRYQQLLIALLLVASLGFIHAESESGSSQFARIRQFLQRFVRHAVAYGLGLAAPLATSGWVNHMRLGTWNPVSKGPGYIPAPIETLARKADTGSLFREWAHSLSLRLVDFSALHDFGTAVPGGENVRPNHVMNAVVYGGVVKKALLQSAPWVVVGLAAFLMIWFRTAAVPERPRREIRALAIIPFGVFAVFATAGATRTEGYCFSMRYFLELLPLFALATGWTLDRLPCRVGPVLCSMAVGAAPAIVAAFFPVESTIHQWIILRIPLILAAVVVLLLLLGRFSWQKQALPLAVAGAFGWAVAVHMIHDVRGAHQVREKHRHYREVVAPHLTPAKTALIAYWGGVTPFFPLQLDFDLLMVDTKPDAAASAPRLIDELLARGFRVLVLPQTMPKYIESRVLQGRYARQLEEERLAIVEIAR